MADVIVVGNVGIDTNVYLHGADVDWSVEANFTSNLDYVGQAGGYSSRGFAQLGQHTGFIGAIGDDTFGTMVRAAFVRDGIDTSGLFIDPAGTSRSVNIMYRDGRRKNFYDGKSHMQLQPDLDGCAALLQGAKLALFHLPNWARHLLPLARAAGAIIASDLQDVVQIDDPYRRDFAAAADILFCSASNHPDPTALIEYLLGNRADRIVIVGRGAQGVAVGTNGGISTFPTPPLDLPLIDTNGAGDALAVSFLTGYVLEGRSLDESVLRGQLAARHACAQRASSDTLVTPALLDDYQRQMQQRPGA